MKIQTVFRLAVIAILVFPVGCQSEGNPWQVEKYRSPGEFTPTPQSTYAPVPRILPSVEGVDLEPLNPTQESTKNSTNEIDRILEELQVK